MPIQRPTYQRPDPSHASDGERTRLAITMGDPNGIGPEVLLKCLHDPELTSNMAPVVIGSAHVLRVHADTLGYSDLTIHTVSDIPDDVPETGVTVLDVTGDTTPEVSFGDVTASGGTLAMAAVDRAVDACLSGDVAAMVTAPISKDAIAKAGFTVPGHTEFIAKKTGGQQPTMMMVAGTLRVGLVTAHIPISQVADAVTEAAIRQKLDVMVEALAQDFGIPEPRVGVLGLNPHAGDGGVLGSEEKEIIEPAVQKARADGIDVHGPLPADGYFATQLNQGYDAVLAMYHDQGLVPFKALAFDRGVNYTAGLPIVRTSPDHGTAYGIAGRGMALPGSMRSAIEEAVAIARHRAATMPA
ncbi:4-hydroxythreonine-4-phosphate dehydrogenase PdxA [Longibacter sp.]|uniref:4-hydroxythreonine-4-phosphate dehydrogenase PdxA n=1 Tax=Longibacter sp. TaxID=2045415 RepID=UPI003EBBADA9